MVHGIKVIVKILFSSFKRNEEGQPENKEGKKIIEFIAIQRRDNNEWAIPGVSVPLPLVEKHDKQLIFYVNSKVFLKKCVVVDFLTILALFFYNVSLRAKQPSYYDYGLKFRCKPK